MSRRQLRAIPDGVIGAYFAAFALVVVAFLSVQTVRAHTLGREHPASVQSGGATAR